MLKGRYEILKGYENNHVTIGFGSYGQVKLAKDIESGSVVAVKIINKIAKNQVQMHNKLNHPNIIELLDCQVDLEREITYMILEYAEEGTLFEKIKMTSISKQDIKKYFKDVCEAVAYLHHQNIMHRDIKPENILLTKKNQAKLCDFGFAALLGERKTLCGTYQYMSPEMIQNKPYDYKIDIWALGILLFELITGHAPFRGDKPEEVLDKMKTKIFFSEKFELEEINLIKTILRVTPSKRPSVEEILENGYFCEQKNQKGEEKDLTYISSSTEGSKFQASNLSNLNDSYKLNDYKGKNIGEYSKGIEKEVQKEQQKQPQNSYPFYIPKNHQKFMAATVNTETQPIKNVSPHHYKGNTSAMNSNQTTSPSFLSPHQIVPGVYNNLKINNFANVNNSMKVNNNEQASMQNNLIHPNKKIEFGRFS